MVPGGMLASVTNTGVHRFRAQKLLNDTARVILNTANKAWELRNTQVLEWERGQPGLTEQKIKANRRQWKRVGGEPKPHNQTAITEIESVREQATREARYEAIRARDRVTAALQTQNEMRVLEGRVPTSEQWCRARADKAAARAHKQVTRRARHWDEKLSLDSVNHADDRKLKIFGSRRPLLFGRAPLVARVSQGSHSCQLHARTGCGGAAASIVTAG